MTIRVYEFGTAQEAREFLNQQPTATATAPASPYAKAWATRKAKQQQPASPKIHRDHWTAEEDGIIKALAAEAGARSLKGRIKKRVYNKLNRLLKHRTSFAIHRRVAVMRKAGQI